MNETGSTSLRFFRKERRRIGRKKAVWEFGGRVFHLKPTNWFPFHLPPPTRSYSPIYRSTRPNTDPEMVNRPCLCLLDYFQTEKRNKKKNPSRCLLHSVTRRFSDKKSSTLSIMDKKERKPVWIQAGLV